jgi:hypothetical protein
MRGVLRLRGRHFVGHGKYFPLCDTVRHQFACMHQMVIPHGIYKVKFGVLNDDYYESQIKTPIYIIENANSKKTIL